MFSFIVKKITQYLIVLGFTVPVIGSISLILENESKPISRKILTIPVEPKIQAAKSTNQEIITIDNFPVKSGNLTSGFGMRNDPFSGKRRMHQGLDIAAKSGTHVYPLGKGKVIFSGYKAGFGNTVEILHGSTIITRYSHLKKTLVTKDQTVTRYNTIALVGNTGRSTGPHLHLEVALNGKTVDPKIFLIGHLASR